MKAFQKKRLREELEKRVADFNSRQNPSKEEYLNLDLLLRISGVVTDIDRLWIQFGYIGYKNGWDKEAELIFTKIMSNGK